MGKKKTTLEKYTGINTYTFSISQLSLYLLVKYSLLNPQSDTCWISLTETKGQISPLYRTFKNNLCKTMSFC